MVDLVFGSKVCRLHSLKQVCVGHGKTSTMGFMWFYDVLCLSIRYILFVLPKGSKGSKKGHPLLKQQSLLKKSSFHKQTNPVDEADLPTKTGCFAPGVSFSADPGEMRPSSALRGLRGVPDASRVVLGDAAQALGF